jgi:hypothetical protein
LLRRNQGGAGGGSSSSSSANSSAKRNSEIANEFMELNSVSGSGGGGSPSLYTKSPGKLKSPGSGAGGSSNGSGNSNAMAVTSIHEALEHGEQLKKEIERVSTGLTLLSQSVDKLQEVVESDYNQGCFGGVFDGCFASYSTQQHKKAGYSKVEGNEDDGSTHGLTAPDPRSNQL